MSGLAHGEGITRCIRRRFLAVGVWILVAASGIGAVRAEPTVDFEKAAKVKAAYLRYIAEFTTWPVGVLDEEGGPIVIGAMGPDPHGVAEILERGVARNRLQAQDRPIQLRRLPDAPGPDLDAALADCHLLFITGSQGVAETWRSLRRVLAERPIVTIAEHPGFSLSDGMIEFVIEERESRVTMHIDLDAVQRARLRLSSHLLGLKDGVRIVRRAGDGAACLGGGCQRPTASSPEDAPPAIATEMVAVDAPAAESR